MKTNNSAAFVNYALIVAALAFSCYAISTHYPQKRVLTWFEFATDGMAPDFVAEDSRKVMGRIWTRAFREGHMEGVVKAISQHASDRVDIIELAAGSGVAAALWNQALTKEDHLVRTVLTDLQPTPDSWRGIVNSSPNISYIAQPVDATDAAEIMVQNYPDWGKDDTMEIRMIHFALHHMTPKVSKELIKDAVQSNATLVIGDLVPSIENVFFSGIAAFFEMQWLIPSLLKERPWEILLIPFLPVFLFMGMHDGAVSTLRSYSHGQIEDMLEECTSSYEVQSFFLYSYADIFGLPIPFLKKPHIQFLVAVPKNDS